MTETGRRTREQTRIIPFEKIHFSQISCLKNQKLNLCKVHKRRLKLRLTLTKFTLVYKIFSQKQHNLIN